MTSRLTSRFRLRGHDAAAHSADAEKLPASDTPAKVEETAKPDFVKQEAAPVADAAPKPDAADPSAGAAAPAETKAALPPSRLVEVDRKASRDASWTKPWLEKAEANKVPAAIAAALVLALGLGFGVGKATRPADAAAVTKSALMIEATAKELRDAHGQIGQLASELKAVKGVVEGMKTERDKTRGEVLSKQAQLTDRVERSGQENATRIGRLAEQLDRIEKSQRDTNRQGPEKGAAADKAERPEKAEKIAAAPVPPVKPNLEVAHTGSIGEAKPAEKIDPRKTPLDGYVVRDYDEGYALIETRSGRYIDVAVGYTLPGIGKVEAIERRGRQWVVVTPKGFIGER